MSDRVLKKIKQAAQRDNKKRLDLRYLRSMAFLTKKGALKSNRDFSKWYAGKLYLADALWAGKHLEPRILEVLPAMKLRFPKEVVLINAPKAFLDAVDALKKKRDKWA